MLSRSSRCPKCFVFSERFSCLLERFCKNYNTFGVVGQMAFILPCIFVGLRTAFVMSWNTFFLQQRPRVLEQRLVCFAHPPLPEALFGFLCLATSGLFCHQSKTDGLRSLIEDRLLLTLCVWIQAESSITRLLASEAGGAFT